MSLQPGTTDLVSDPMCVIISANTPMYFAWMATLPFAGALAAALARRADASSRERLMAALFPAFALAIETALLAVISGFFWRIPVYWVLMPAVMCVLGAVPFLLPQQRGPVHDHVQT
jgi:mannitol-specific phosphotransferase system IIBC component